MTLKSSVIIGMGTIALIVAIIPATRSNTYASTVSECIDDGYEDGKKGKWALDREYECIRIADEGNPYRNALEKGCHAVEFLRENCDEINH